MKRRFHSSSLWCPYVTPRVPREKRGPFAVAEERGIARSRTNGMLSYAALPFPDPKPPSARPPSQARIRMPFSPSLQSQKPLLFPPPPPISKRGGETGLFPSRRQRRGKRGEEGRPTFSSLPPSPSPPSRCLRRRWQHPRFPLSSTDSRRRRQQRLSLRREMVNTERERRRRRDGWKEPQRGKGEERKEKHHFFSFISLLSLPYLPHSPSLPLPFSLSRFSSSWRPHSSSQRPRESRDVGR